MVLVLLVLYRVLVLPSGQKQFLKQQLRSQLELLLILQILNSQFFTQVAQVAETLLSVRFLDRQ